MNRPRWHNAMWWLVPLPFLDAGIFLLQKSASRAAADDSLLALAHRPEFWLALLLAPVQLVVWLRVLQRLHLGSAYGLTSMAYPITMVAATFIFAERYGWKVWLGAALITAGAFLLSGSTVDDGHAEEKPLGPTQE
jgi:drug/metabolite transporter (DMT)-like permease